MILIARLIWTAAYGCLVLVALFFALGFGAFSGSPLGCLISLAAAAILAWRAWAAWNVTDEPPAGRQVGYSYDVHTGEMQPIYRDFDPTEASRAAWASEPPTEKQLGFLYHLGHRGPPPRTKAEASDMIDALKRR